MGCFLIVVQIFIWICGGVWIVNYFEVDSLLLKFLVFGITGVSVPLVFFVVSVAFHIVVESRKDDEVAKKDPDRVFSQE